MKKIIKLMLKVIRIFQKKKKADVDAWYVDYTSHDSYDGDRKNKK
jgi:hypothetical protein